MTPQELSPKERHFYEAKIVVHALEMALIGPAMHEHMLRCELTPDEIKRANDAFMKTLYRTGEQNDAARTMAIPQSLHARV